MPYRGHLLDEVIAFESIGPVATNQLISAPTADQLIVAVPAIQVVVTDVLAGQLVVVAIDHIVVGAAIQQVCGASSKDHVVAGTTVDDVLTMAAGIQGVTDGATGAVEGQVLNRAARGQRHLVVALKAVVTGAAVDHVVTVIARDLVIASASIDHVVARAGVDHIVPSARIDQVVSIADVGSERGTTREVGISSLRASRVGARV